MPSINLPIFGFNNDPVFPNLLTREENPISMRLGPEVIFATPERTMDSISFSSTCPKLGKIFLYFAKIGERAFSIIESTF